MKTMKRTIAVLFTVTALTVGGGAAPLHGAQRPVAIQLATVAPKDSSWHQTLMEMGAEWRAATSDAVRYRVFPGGQMGDESEVIIKMRTAALAGRGLNAAAISNDGLAEIEPAAFALNMPLVFDSYEEWDYIRRQVNPLLERRLAAKGFIVLAWSDIGWVHFFSRQPLRHPDQLQDRKLAASATDDDQVNLLKSLGFNPVPTSQHDVISGLKTGLIDTLYVPIILAQASQIYRDANHMMALEWAPLQGAIVVHESTWNRIASAHRDAMLRISREIGERLRADNRDLEQRSLEAMVERGLNVVEVDEAAVSAWRRLTEDNYDRIRGELVDADVFDRVMELRDQYRRSTHNASSTR